MPVSQRVSCGASSRRPSSRSLGAGDGAQSIPQAHRDHPTLTASVGTSWMEKADGPHTHTTRHLDLAIHTTSLDWAGRSSEAAVKQAPPAAPPSSSKQQAQRFEDVRAPDRGQDYIVRWLNALCLSPHAAIRSFDALRRVHSSTVGLTLSRGPPCRHPTLFRSS